MGHDSENPISRLVGNLYSLASIAIVVVGLAAPFLLLPKLIVMRGRAESRIERAYWNMEIFGASAVIYGTVMIGLLFLGNAVYRWDFNWWPSISWLFLEGDPTYRYKQADGVMIDSLICFFGGTVFWMCTGILGGIDSLGRYEPPEWYWAKKSAE